MALAISSCQLEEITSGGKSAPGSNDNRAPVLFRAYTSVVPSAEFQLRVCCTILFPLSMAEIVPLEIELDRLFPRNPNSFMF